jgi:hypothetical protein
LAGGVGLSRVKHQPLQVNPQSKNKLKCSLFNVQIEEEYEGENNQFNIKH